MPITKTSTEFMPKKIYALWLQGRENAPELVRINFDRWERLNPDYELIVLTRETATPYLKGFPIDPNKLTVQTFSDILRVRLLAQNGGIWTDASVYPTRPLSKWLNKTMKTQTFFAYDNPNPYHMPVASWFLVARYDCPMIKKWNDLITRYWFMEREPIHQENNGDENRGEFYYPADVDAEMGLLDMRPTPGYPYFWVHHLFGHLLRHDTDFAAEWDAITDNDYLPAVLLDHLHEDRFFYPIRNRQTKLSWSAHKRLFKRFNSAYTRWLLSKANMHKLNWRCKSYPFQMLKNFRK